MSKILHDFPISAPRAAVFAAVATPAGLDQWWTLRSKGEATLGASWELFFDAAYDWRGKVVRLVPDEAIEWEMTLADADWTGTRVSLDLSDRPGGVTWVRFAHVGWQDRGEHYRVSSCCWAMYLRILRRWLEAGESVPYAERLAV